jgi:hypothetical protein
MDCQTKDIKGFPGYRIDSEGRIWSCWSMKGNNGKTHIMSNQWKERSPSQNNFGYWGLQLFKNGKYYHKYIHRLLAESFILKIKNKPLVLHKNGNHLDNSLQNLYWGDYKDNSQDAINHGTHPGFKTKGEKVHCSKLNQCKVKEIRYLKFVFPDLSNAHLAREFKVSTTSIWYIIHRKTWKHV